MDIIAPMECPTETLRKENVWIYALMLAGEHLPGAADAALDIALPESRGVAERAEILQIASRGVRVTAFPGSARRMGGHILGVELPGGKLILADIDASPGALGSPHRNGQGSGSETERVALRSSAEAAVAAGWGHVRAGGAPWKAPGRRDRVAARGMAGELIAASTASVRSW